MRLVALVWALVFVGCAQRAPAPEQAPSNTPALAVPALPTSVPIKIHSFPGRGSKYIYLTEQKRNRIVYVLRADSNTSIQLSKGSGRSDFVNPHVTFHGTGKTTVVADAPHATVLERDRSVLMSGGVRARNNEGMRLQSDTMRYDDANESLHGEGNVTITTPQGEELRGDRFDYDLRTTEMRVTGSRQ